ncbi:hypothetical protein SAMN06265827_11066 [Orenia metallireducens]|uniref:Uncharacterized protein n=1 Tax=Orenia metallireducens TaxID=1413210 RepID=A0A285GWG7_9FIRM|nr:hypothetical protein [Orenia metallireducens]SNY26876.1 hypothetical protein SAMN06265827_11066 [Orenia metallireducens]
MGTKLEEIIFTQYLGIDLNSLNDNELIDPTKIKISPELHDKIVTRIKEEYGLNDLEVNLILLQYGANVSNELAGNKVELLDGYIKKTN